MIDNLRRGSPLSNELKLTTVCFVIKPTSRRRVNWDKPGKFMTSRMFENKLIWFYSIIIENPVSPSTALLNLISKR